MTTAPDRNRLMVVDSGDDVSALQQVVALDHFRRTGHTGHTGHSFDNSSSSRGSSRGSRSRSGDEGEPKQPANNNNNNNNNDDGGGDGGGGGGGGGGFVNTAPTSCPPIFGPHVGGESVANITKRMMALVPLPGGAGTCKTLN